MMGFVDFHWCIFCTLVIYPCPPVIHCRVNRGGSPCLLIPQCITSVIGIFPLEKKPGDSKGGVGGLCILRGKGVLSIEFHHSSLSLNPQLGGEGNGPAPLVF